LENVLDLGTLTVRDVMHRRAQVRALDARRRWADTPSIIQVSHFTRYPLITAGRSV
jgi:CBS domain containing-hemolysin-like protein